MYKRVTAAVVALILFIGMISAGARDLRFYAEYQQKSAKSSAFYVDIYCAERVSAAVLTADYDTTLAEYRTVYPGTDDAIVKAHASGSSIRIVLCDNAPAGGRLCRLHFIRTGTGTFRISLHMERAVDENLSYLTDLPVYILTSDLTANSSSGTKKAEKSSSKSSQAQERTIGDVSPLGYVQENPSVVPTAEDGSLLVNYADPHGGSYFMLGVGSALLAILLIALGIFIGYRLSVKKKAPPQPCDETHRVDADGMTDSDEDEPPVSE